MHAFVDITSPKGGEIYLLKGKEETPSGRFPFALCEDYSFRLEGDDRLTSPIDKAVLSLPPQMLNFRVMEMPLSEPDKIRDVLPFELEGIILGRPSDYIIDCAVLKDRRVLAVYIEKHIMGRLLEGLNALGIDPYSATSIEVGRAVSASDSPDALMKALLDGENIEAGKRHAYARSEAKEPTINLRRGGFSYKKETEKFRRHLRIAAFLVVISTLLWSADTVIRTAAKNKEARKIEAAISKTYAALFPGVKTGGAEDIIMRLKSHIKEAKGKDALVTGIRPLESLLLLQNASMTGLSLQSITIDKDMAVLKGEAPSLGEVQRYKDGLSAYLSDVKISDTGQSAKDRTVFTITGKGK